MFYKSDAEHRPTKFPALLPSGRANALQCSRRLLAIAVASVPFVCVFLVDYTLRQEGWRVWSSGVYLCCCVLLLLGAWFWARHFLRGTPSLSLACILLGLASVWVVVRSDWIVKTDYVYMGQIGHQTYTPPVSPMWQPPHPQQLSSTATSWKHMDFFYIGGSGGPIEEPSLHINWALTVIKLTFITVTGYWIIRWFRKYFSSKRTQRTQRI